MTDDKERAFLMAVAEIYPELPLLGAGNISVDLHKLLLKGISGEAIETDVNKLLLVYEQAVERFIELRKKYKATTQSTPRFVGVPHKPDAATLESSPEVLTTKPIIANEDNIVPFPMADVVGDLEFDRKYNNILELIFNFLDIEKDKRAALRKEIDEKLDEILNLQGVPPDKRATAKHAFMVATYQALVDANRPSLPDSPPEMWKKGQGETALEFLQRVYKPWLEARVLTYAWLQDNDSPLRIAVSTAVSRNQNDSTDLLPLTASDLLDMEYQKYNELYGAEHVKRMSSVFHSIKKREARNAHETDQGSEGIEPRQ